MPCCRLNRLAIELVLPLSSHKSQSRFDRKKSYWNLLAFISRAYNCSSLAQTLSHKHPSHMFSYARDYKTLCKQQTRREFTNRLSERVRNTNVVVIFSAFRFFLPVIVYYYFFASNVSIFSLSSFPQSIQKINGVSCDRYENIIYSFISIQFVQWKNEANSTIAIVWEYHGLFYSSHSMVSILISSL